MTTREIRAARISSEQFQQGCSVMNMVASRQRWKSARMSALASAWTAPHFPSGVSYPSPGCAERVHGQGFPHAHHDVAKVSSSYTAWWRPRGHAPSVRQPGSPGGAPL